MIVDDNSSEGNVISDLIKVKIQRVGVEENLRIKVLNFTFFVEVKVMRNINVENNRNLIVLDQTDEVSPSKKTAEKGRVPKKVIRKIKVYQGGTI